MRPLNEQIDMIKKQEEDAKFLQQVQDAILAVNLYGEKPKSKRTEQENQMLDDADQFLRECAPDVIDIKIRPLFEEMAFSSEGDRGDLLRWMTVLNESKAPEIKAGRVYTLEELAGIYQQCCERNTSVSGCYEEITAIITSWDEAMSKASLVMRAIWRFDTIDSMKALFEAIVPAEVNTNIRRLREYEERFKRRLEQFKFVYNTLTHMENIAMGTPVGARRIMEPGDPAPTLRPAPAESEYGAGRSRRAA